MKEILQFLRDLYEHNDRAWFQNNKQRYLAAQQKWNDFCEELIHEVGLFDSSIANLKVLDCTYRICRDARFSKDKSPYKTHFGVFLCPGGKKSMHAGYYFHVGIGGDAGYPHSHMIAAGNYCYEPRVVKLLREDISYGWKEFKEQTLDVVDSRFAVDMEGALKKVPAGFASDAPYADWIRLKSYCLFTNVDDEFLCRPQLAQRVASLFKTTQPFCDFINRAVDYRE